MKAQRTYYRSSPFDAPSVIDLAREARDRDRKFLPLDSYIFSVMADLTQNMSTARKAEAWAAVRSYLTSQADAAQRKANALHRSGFKVVLKGNEAC